jgi:hypothetical protein
MKFGLFGGARARGGPAGDSHAYHDFVNYVIEAEKLGFTSVFWSSTTSPALAKSRRR